MIAARRLAPLVWITAIGAAVWLVFGHGFVQYDTFYALDWGHQIVHGQTPDSSAPLAPTPHPLATGLGVILAPFGDGAAAITLAISFFAIGAVAYLLFRLGQEWFNPWAGLTAAAIMLTREPLLSVGVRAYIDIAYLAFVLWALLVETRRPQAGMPVVVLLVFAGLLRPEAWLLSIAYLLYLGLDRDPGRDGWLGIGRRRGQERGELIRLVAVAALAPVLWALYDLITTGDPLHSFTGTRDTVETLSRETGIADAIAKGPFRLGEILREPGLFGAALGLVFSLIYLPRRRGILLGATALAVSLIAFGILAAAGLAVITRYLLLPAAIASVFCGAALFGWLELKRNDAGRSGWLALAALFVLGTIVFIPSQADRISSLHGSIAAQERILDDLHDLTEDGRFESACAPVTVPNHRPIPFLALWLDRTPTSIVSAQLERPDRGYFVSPASPFVERNFTLDPHDPKRLTATVPPGFRRVAANRSWVLYSRC
jgi:hypothetical protein